MSQIEEVIQSPIFAKQKKKLKKNQIKKLDEAIKTIMADPKIGNAKSGDLQGVRVYKYKLGNNQKGVSTSLPFLSGICDLFMPPDYLLICYRGNSNSLL